MSAQRPAAHRALRAAGRATLTGVPVGDGLVDLALERASVFHPDVRIVVVDAGGARSATRPDLAVFTGRVVGRDDARVVVVADGAGLEGLVVAPGGVDAFGSGADGTLTARRVTAPPDVAPACGGALPPPGPARVAREAGSADGALLDADLAIETDHELWAEFGDDDATLRYVARLVAAMNTIWQRDVGVRFRVRFVRVWATPDDPWQASDREGALHELDAWWSDPANQMDVVAGPHAVVHLVSGKSPSQGGIAFLGTACEPTGNFGVSQVHGAFGLLDPAQTWDVDVVTHEIAHAFGSLHSHCYDPPLDHCWNAEPGCWAGPIEPGSGTIMSYCQTLPGGMNNVELVFGAAVSEVLRTGAVSAGCLERAQAVCGDGRVDAGETCDDGNTVDGDCCSALCQAEAEGSACTLAEDGDVCTVGRCDGLGGCVAARPSTGTLATTLSAPQRAPGCRIPPRLSRLLTRATNLLNAFPPDHAVTNADARHLLHVIQRAKRLVPTLPRACRGPVKASLKTTRLLTLCTM